MSKTKESISMSPVLVDGFGRQIRYLRLSVTDRCDFRCVYCMEEDAEFVPRSEVLSLEEMRLLAQVFVGLGVRKIRLTGGEPLVRSQVTELCRMLSGIDALDELVMTTNGSQLARLAPQLRKAGLQRLNISLDTLRPERFRSMTRTGSLAQVLSGIESASKQGFDRIKLNAVIMRNRNEDELFDLVDFARARGFDISFIEEMPLGEIREHRRDESFISSSELRARLAQRFTLLPVTAKHNDGPSRYFAIEGGESRVGFISPHSNNFCGDCNRVRVTAEGRLLLCLGNEDSLDLRAILRSGHADVSGELRRRIVEAMQLKPERHHFSNAGEPQILRFMNATGG